MPRYQACVRARPVALALALVCLLVIPLHARATDRAESADARPLQGVGDFVSSLDSGDRPFRAFEDLEGGHEFRHGPRFEDDLERISAIPEPASSGLVLLGLGALGIALRGKRRR